MKVTATDISAEAVETAEANAEDLRVKVRFITGDMFEPVKGRKFDMIVSNPPYIRTNMISILQEEVKDHEPLNALDGGRDGLVILQDYRGKGRGFPENRRVSC